MDLKQNGAEISVVKRALDGIGIDELHLKGLHTLSDEANIVRCVIVSVSDMKIIRKNIFTH